MNDPKEQKSGTYTSWEFNPPGYHFGKAITTALKDPIGKVRFLCLKCKKEERPNGAKFCIPCNKEELK